MNFEHEPIKTSRYSKDLRGRFNSFIVTDFDDSMTVEMQMRSMIKWMRENIDSIQDMVDYINEFNEWLNTCQYDKHMINVLDQWLNTGYLLDELLKTLNFEYTINEMENRIDELKFLFSQADFYSKEEINEKFDISLGQAYADEPYYEDRVRPIFETTISDFRSRFDKVKSGRFNFGFMTDTHYSPNDVYWGKIGDATTSITHLYNLALFSNQLAFVSFGGDNVDSANPYTKYDSYSFNSQFVSTALTLMACPVFFGLGNHDDNNIGVPEKRFEPYKSQIKTQLDNIVSNDEFKVLYQQDKNLFGEVRNNQSNYLYKDFNDEKIRYIWLDVYDNDMTLNEDGMLKYPRNTFSMISKEQIKWLIQNALNLPSSEWTVLIGLHCPLQDTVTHVSTTCVNHDKVETILKAFRNGGSGSLAFSETDTCDYVAYSFQPSKLAAVINGHLHYDGFVKKDNINYVSVDCSLGGAHPDKHYFTPMEDSWKVFSVDTTNEEIDIVTFGRGSDRKISYKRVEV